MSAVEEETVPCETCGEPGLTGTKRCNNCFEVETRLVSYFSRGKEKAVRFVMQAYALGRSDLLLDWVEAERRKLREKEPP